MLVDTYLKIICANFIIVQTGITGSLLFLSSSKQSTTLRKEPPRDSEPATKAMNFLRTSSLLKLVELNRHRICRSFHQMIECLTIETGSPSTQYSYI